MILFTVEKYLKVDTWKKMFAECRNFTETTTTNVAQTMNKWLRKSRKVYANIISCRLEIIEHFIFIRKHKNRNIYNLEFKTYNLEFQQQKYIANYIYFFKYKYENRQYRSAADLVA